MNIELAHRVKTFGLAVAVLLATVAAGGNWLDHSVPLDGVATSTEPLSQTEGESQFVQSGGLVPDACGDADSAEGDGNPSGNTRIATAS
jgi:hypothetical protein